MSIISWTSPSPSCRIFPASSVTSRPSASLLTRNSSPNRRISSPRRGAGTSRHAWKAFTEAAPKIDDFLSDEAQDFFAKVTSGLDAAGVAWTRAPALVRGLDYYRHTAFEFVTDRLGAQGTVLGGGRYDGLMESLGGAHTPAVGWAAGVERLAMLVADAGQVAADPQDVILAIEDDAAIGFGIAALKALRSAGLSADMIATGSPRKRFDKASKLPSRVLVGVALRDGKIACNSRSAEHAAVLERVNAVLETLPA